MATISSNGTGGGLWSQGSTWAGGVKPAPGDTVQIVGTDVVEVDESFDVGLGDGVANDAISVAAGATLKRNRSAATPLTMVLRGNLEGSAGWTLDFGKEGDALPAYRDEIRFDGQTAAGQYGANLIDCHLFIYGNGGNVANGVLQTTLASQLTAGTATCTLAEAVSWQAGDWVAISYPSGTDRAKAECLQIQSIVGGTDVTFTGNAVYTHAVGCAAVIVSIGSLTICGTSSYNSFVRIDTDGYQAKVRFCSFDRLGINTNYKYGVQFTGWDENGEWADVSCRNLLHFMHHQGSMWWTAARLTFYNAHFNVYRSETQGFGVSEVYIVAAGTTGINAAGMGHVFRDIHIWNAGYAVTPQGWGQEFTDIECLYGYQALYLASAFAGAAFVNLVSSGNQYCDVQVGKYYGQHQLLLLNPSLNHPSNPIVSWGDLPVGAWCRIQQYNGGAEDHRMYRGAGLIQTETSYVHSVGNSAIRFVPRAGEVEALSYQLRVPCADGDVLALWGFASKNSANFTLRPTVDLETDDGGVAATFTMSDSVDTWEWFGLGGAKAGDGYLTVRLRCKASAGDSAYFDDMRLMVGNAVYDIGQDWIDGALAASFAGIATLPDALNALRTGFNQPLTVGRAIADAASYSELDFILHL